MPHSKGLSNNAMAYIYIYIYIPMSSLTRRKLPSLHASCSNTTTVFFRRTLTKYDNSLLFDKIFVVQRWMLKMWGRGYLLCGRKWWNISEICRFKWYTLLVGLSRVMINTLTSEHTHTIFSFTLCFYALRKKSVL